MAEERRKLRRRVETQWGARMDRWGACNAWMEKEGISLYQDICGFEDITALPRRPWARLGGNGCFIEVEGTKQAGKGLYVLEIPGGGAVEPEKHLYDEILYILRGRGLAEVWNEGQSKRSFEWGEGSLFAIPLNASHRLVNGTDEPVLVFGQTSAPLVMNTLGDVEFIFNCHYNFTDRYGGQEDYFVTKEVKPEMHEEVMHEVMGRGEAYFGWKTNFVPDVRKVRNRFDMDAWEGSFTMDLRPARYATVHYHGPSAVLLGTMGQGYHIMWDKRYGIHPYQDGHGDKVVTMKYQPNSIISPPSGWFHGRYNTGREYSQLVATTGGGTTIELPTLQKPSTWQVGSTRELGQWDIISVREGGTRIDLEDMDPEFHRMYEEELRKNGIKPTMPRPVYRTDPIELFF